MSPYHYNQNGNNVSTNRETRTKKNALKFAAFLVSFGGISASCSFENSPKDFLSRRMNLAKARKFFRGEHLIPVKKSEKSVFCHPGGKVSNVLCDGDIRKCDVLRLCDARDTSLSRNLTLRMTEAYKYRMIMMFVKNCRDPLFLCPWLTRVDA